MTATDIVVAVILAMNLSLSLWTAFMLIGILPRANDVTNVSINEPFRAFYYRRRGSGEWAYVVYSALSGYQDTVSVAPNERHSDYVRSWMRGYGLYIHEVAEVTESHAHHIREQLNKLAKVV